jgi:hypothetical protein
MNISELGSLQTAFVTQQPVPSRIENTKRDSAALENSPQSSYTSGLPPCLKKQKVSSESGCYDDAGAFRSKTEVSEHEPVRDEAPKGCIEHHRIAATEDPKEAAAPTANESTTLDFWQTGSGQHLGRQEGWARLKAHEMVKRRQELNLIRCSYRKNRSSKRDPFPLKALIKLKKKGRAKVKSSLQVFLAERACASANLDYKICNSYEKVSNIPHNQALEAARLAIQPIHVLTFLVDQFCSAKSVPSGFIDRNALLSGCKTSEQVGSALSSLRKHLEAELEKMKQKIQSAGGVKKASSFDVEAMQNIKQLCEAGEDAKMAISAACNFSPDMLPNQSLIGIGYERCFTDLFHKKWLWKTYQDHFFVNEMSWHKEPYPNRSFEVIHEYEAAVEPERCFKMLESSKTGCVAPPDLTQASPNLHLDMHGLKEGRPLRLAPVGFEFPALGPGAFDIVLSSTWGFDSSTQRKIIRALLMNTVLEESYCIQFIERILLPAINRQKDSEAYDIATALHDIIRKSRAAGNAFEVQAASTVLQEVHKDRVFAKNTSFRVHPKGQGLLCNRRVGFRAGAFVEQYLGELYSPWRWFEKTDAVKVVQKKLGKKSALPDFYNIALDRHKDDLGGYNVMYVDPIARGNIASRLSHSCTPNCATVVVSIEGHYKIAVFALRDIAYGEELTFDYGAFTEDKLEHEQATCLCGSHNCRGAFLQYSNDKYFQVIMSAHQNTLDRTSQIVRASTEPFLEEDRLLLEKHNLRDSVQDGAPDWLLKWGALILEFADFEKEQLIAYLQRKYKGIYNLQSARDEGQHIHATRVQNLVITLEKIKYVLRQKGQSQAPPVRILSTSEVIDALWTKGKNGGKDGIVRDIARLGLKSMDAKQPELSMRLKEILKIKVPRTEEGLRYLRENIILEIRDMFWKFKQTPSKRFAAAGDLLTLYAHTKMHFTNTSYIGVKSPSIKLRQCDVGETIHPLSEKSEVVKGKNYGPGYIWGQMNFWERQTIAQPDSSLMAARYGPVVLPDATCCFSTTLNDYGPSRRKDTINRWVERPHEQIPTRFHWRFKNPHRIYGSPMLDEALRISVEGYDCRPNRESDRGDTGPNAGGSIAPSTDSGTPNAEDDLPCNICGLTGDSAANPALLCETCDLGCAHIQCINLQSVPSGDWFCAICEAKKNDLPQWLLEIKGHKLL